MKKVIETLCKEYGTLIHVKKNTILFHADSSKQAPYIYYLVEGICALTGNSYHGQEQVLLYFKEGYLVGINPILGGFADNFYAYSTPTGVAKTDCIMYRIPVAPVQKLLETSLEFNRCIVDTLSEYYHHTIAHLKQIQEDSTITVICRFLLFMSERREQGLVLSKFFTYEEISRYLGVHMVTAGKIISKLQQLGYIKRISAGILILDEEALKDLIVNCETFKY